MTTISYIKNFLKDKSVASITPSSRYTTKAICKKIDFNKDNIIIEYGPGSGVISKELLNNLSLESKLILIEQNNNFIRHLTKIKDDRLIVVKDDAKHIKHIMKRYNISKADYIISGIPFSMIPDKDKSNITLESYDALKDKGKFILYQTSSLMKKYLNKYFHTKTNFNIRNIPPLTIMEGTKKSTGNFAKLAKT